ncbi:MAG: hypothetical protein HKM87_07395 [Ignavibacteriaceae bacterium]|nr:hypothetical protein [Ignavibacteriaceae bacterium]
MDLELKPGITFEGMNEVLSRECTVYKIKLLKNPVAKFQYIQVEKSALVGIWIRIMEKKNIVKLINTMPSTLARVPLLGLVFTLILQGFMNASQSKVRDEVAEILKKEYGTKEV